MPPTPRPPLRRFAHSPKSFGCGSNGGGTLIGLIGSRQHRAGSRLHLARRRCNRPGELADCGFKIAGERLHVNRTLLPGLARRRLLVGKPAGADHRLLEYLHRLGHRPDFIAATLVRDHDVDRTAGECGHRACQPDGRTRNRPRDQQCGGDRGLRRRPRQGRGR